MAALVVLLVPVLRVVMVRLAMVAMVVLPVFLVMVVTVLLDNLMESEAINVTVLLALPVVVKAALTVMLPP